tara:strand:+ start:268 stop:453 length:186 start_codon:yes stop_codon:yes gene_type:complete
MSEVVHSVNIMIAILLVGVCVTIYWVFKYDDWNPNPITTEHTSASISDSRGNGAEGKGISV